VQAVEPGRMRSARRRPIPVEITIEHAALAARRTEGRPRCAAAAWARPRRGRFCFHRGHMRTIPPIIAHRGVSSAPLTEVRATAFSDQPRNFYVGESAKALGAPVSMPIIRRRRPPAGLRLRGARRGPNR
jgi:hypothetical protein